MLEWVARRLLSGIFVVGGTDVLRNPGPRVAIVEPALGPMIVRSRAPLGPETLVRLNAAVHVTGGLMLAAGKAPRLAALALLASMVPTTFIGHRFWEEQDPARRSQQRTHLLKNLGLMGGLLLEATSKR
jgi:putative oxidoreductase